MTRPLRVVALLVAIGGAACGDAGRVQVVNGAGDVVLRARVDFADTAEERRRGLVGSPPLTADRGLWLRFPTTGEVCITNANVMFPIDVVYVDDSRTIVAIERNVPADDGTPRCHTPIASVLEVAGGVALGANVGDVLEGPL